MSGNTVLVIDDDKSLLKVVQDKLGIEGINSTTALNGSLGVHKAKAEKPNLIVLDMMLGGGMSGFEVLEQLKQDPLTNRIPVIVLSNLDFDDKVAKDIGALDYFVKSNTELDAICKRIKEILGKNTTQQGEHI